MSWDRVIQDSDEEEPLIEDDILASHAPPEKHESPARPHHDHPAKQETDYQIEYTATGDALEPQLNVNFDQFLQSQDGLQTASTSSQQQREERWIPSISQGGAGSIGMSRLLDGCFPYNFHSITHTSMFWSL